MEQKSTESEVMNDKQTSLIGSTVQSLQQINEASQKFNQQITEKFAAIDQATEDLYDNYDDVYANMESWFRTLST